MKTIKSEEKNDALFNVEDAYKKIDSLSVEKMNVIL